MIGSQRWLAVGIVAMGLAGFVIPRAEAGLITFDVSGTFSDGSTLGGSLVIDTTNGLATSSSVTLALVGSSSLAFTTLGSQGYFFSQDIYPIEVLDAAGDYIVFGLVPTNDPSTTPSIVGYAGGPLNSITDSFDGYVTDYQLASGSSAQLSVGALSSVPEPSSLALCGIAGVVGAGMAWKRRKRVG